MDDLMAYAEWTRRYGSVIREDGAKLAALVACVPNMYAVRWDREARRRDAIARSMGGTSRFSLPLGA